MLEYIAERELLYDSSHAKTCQACNNHNILVEPFDISYRNMGKPSEYMDLCVLCKYEIIEQMDDQWSDYHASVMVYWAKI